jgi:tetratricopeptide (TPR) repeat protein
MKHAAAWCVILMSSVCLLSSCTSYVYRSIDIKQSLSRQEYGRALESIEHANTGGSRLVYLYEKGLILHYADDYQRSIDAFGEAEAELDRLYTRSLSREIGALFTSDNVVEYRGDRYEAAYLYYYQILNYLSLGRLEDAAIECRKMNHTLQLFMDNDGSSYRNDPFLQYLSALVYEAYGERADADVSLRVALQSYQELGETYDIPIPSSLYRDLVENAEYFGDAQAAEQYRSECSALPAAGTGPDSGILNLFVECGYVPGKREDILSLPIFKKDLEKDIDDERFAEVLMKRRGMDRPAEVKVDYWLKVAVPALQVEPPGIGGVEITVPGSGAGSVAATPVANLDVLASRAFEEKEGRIYLKTIARALTKYLAKKKAENGKGEIAGWVVNIFNVATETADTRSWSTLPGRIFMGRLRLPQGTHDIELHLLDPSGRRADTVTIRGVAVKAHAQTFLNYRVY